MIIENNLQLILLLIFLVLLLHYSHFLMIILTGFKKLTQLRKNDPPPEFVSVIIPFRNEEKNILKNLKSIEAQNYPQDKYEIIYVNDSSVDDSFNLLRKSISASNIKVISVPEDFSPSAHKKRAIRYGIRNSTGEIIVTSDADCIYEAGWLKTLLNDFDIQTGFVSGPVEFIEENNLSGKFQKLEFAGLVLTGAGLIGAGKPLICNAANIAYRKKAFDEVDGFKDQMNLSSGDDELLMQKIAKDTNYKVRFSMDEQSIVRTSANKSFMEFYQQRKRWASKGLFYRDKTLVVKLLIIYLFFTGLILQFALALFYNRLFFLSLIISMLCKAFLEYEILFLGKKKLFHSLPLKYFLITELLHIPYITIAGLAGVFGNYLWKGRKIRR